MMKALFKAALHVIGQVLIFLLFFMLLGFVAVVAKNSVSVASEFHWLAGVLLSVLWLIGVVSLCFAIWYAMRPTAPSWLRDYMLIGRKTGRDAGLAEQFPAASLSALICVAMLTAVFVLSGVSAVLASKGVLRYAIESPQEKPMTELLFRLYIWHTIDMIPFLNISQVYEIKSPIRPINFWAQSIVLVFRSAVIGFAISVISQWLKFSRDMHRNDKQAGNR